MTGTLGLLDLAATSNLVELPIAIDMLRQTSFRVSRDLIASLLKRHYTSNN
ncbi:MAG: DUF3368 domain-containing protein [Pyrinomonadaceae bacterium]